MGEFYPEVAISALPLWYALVVEPKREHIASRRLEASGFESYLPSRKVKFTRHREPSCLCGNCRKCADRIRKAKMRGEEPPVDEAPLFPGYVFCRFQFIYKSFVKETLGVIDVVQFGPVPIAVPDDVITQIRTMIASGLPLEVEPLPLVPYEGQNVRVTRGTMQDRYGVVSKVLKGSEVSVLIQPLGARLIMRTDCLEEIPPPASRKRFPVCA